MSLGRVEIFVNRFDKNILARQMNGHFGFLLELFDRRDHVHIDALSK